MAKADWQVVEEILNRSKGRNATDTAQEIVKVLKKRIGERRSGASKFTPSSALKPASNISRQP
jgi:hypothetical protein